MAPGSAQRFCVFCVLVIAALVLGTAESAVVREIAKLKQFNGIPGLTHTTIAGVKDGHKEVEAWVETVGAGGGTPIHRHDCEEIFIVVKGGGTVYIAPPSDNQFPGEPVATPVTANSTFSIPPNAVHQFRNTEEEDCHFYVVISRPPFKSYFYKSWSTNHEDATLVFPIPWDITKEEATSTKDEL